jgi:ketosteroid isomerase-like protein
MNAANLMLTREFAEHFAAEWVAAWNAHDLERVLSHYADDFVMTSPFIAQLADEPTGILCGKAVIGAYWASALQLIPDLKFELLKVLLGVNSVTLYYKGAKDRLAAEVFHFGPEGKIVRAYAHYAA